MYVYEKMKDNIYGSTDIKLDLYMRIRITYDYIHICLYMHIKIIKREFCKQKKN